MTGGQADKILGLQDWEKDKKNNPNLLPSLLFIAFLINVGRRVGLYFLYHILPALPINIHRPVGSHQKNKGLGRKLTVD